MEQAAASTAAGAPRRSGDAADDEPISAVLSRTLRSGDATIGSLVDEFEEKAFALIFVLLLGVPALPLPTGGATHVFEVIVVLVAAQLVVGRSRIWLPERWRGLALGGSAQQRFIRGLLRVVTFLERFSKPRLAFLFRLRIARIGFGLAIMVASVAAFLAPPFSGLDTLPAMGGVLIALGVLLEDVAIVMLGAAVGLAGITLEVVLGKAAAGALGRLF
jgi:hypothetical protein